MNPLDSLGINIWSLLLHTINIFSLVVVLTFLVYKPLIKFMGERRTKIKDSLEEIETLKNDFQGKLESMNAEKQLLVQSFTEQMQEGKKDLETQKATLLEEMQTTREALLQKTQKELQEQKDALLANVQKEVLHAMEKIVMTVVNNQLSTTSVSQSVSEEWKKHIAHHS